MQKIVSFLRHLFVPHEENNYRARTLHTDFLGFYLVFALALSVLFKQVGINNVLGFATDISVDKLYQLTNAEREKNGLAPLIQNDRLAKAAADKAANMFSENYWAHYSPSGKTPWEFILGSGYQYEYAGENLAKNFLFSDGVVSAWMNSPTHRDNILKKEYTEVGYAIANGVLNGEQTTLVVQMFAKPAGTVAQLPPPAEVKQTLPKPTVQPQANVIPERQPAVLAKQAPDNKFSLPAITFNMNVVFFAFLLLSLGLDFYFASRFNIVRIGGKNIAHFVFILFMFIGLFIIRYGAII